MYVHVLIAYFYAGRVNLWGARNVPFRCHFTILRQGLRRILEAEPDMAVLGEASTGTDSVKKARQLKPDVVIMDISMPEQDGIESMWQVVKTVNLRVLILSIHLEPQMTSEAVSAGAAGCLAKDSLDSELVSAIRTIMHGGTGFSSHVLKLLTPSGGVRMSAVRWTC